MPRPRRSSRLRPAMPMPRPGLDWAKVLRSCGSSFSVSPILVSALLEELLALDRGDRHGRFEVGTADARTGDGDRLLGRLVRGGLRSLCIALQRPRRIGDGILRKSRRRAAERQAQDGRGSHGARAEQPGLPHSNSPFFKPAAQRRRPAIYDNSMSHTILGEPGFAMRKKRWTHFSRHRCLLATNCGGAPSAGLSIAPCG